MTMTLVETITVGSGGAASIEFTGIPQDGVDLLLKYSSRSSSTSNLALVNLNGDSGSNYTYVSLEGFSGSVFSFEGTLTGARVGGQPSDYTADTFGNSNFYISNYTSAANKSISAEGVAENNGADANIRLFAYSYSTSSSITAISIAPNYAGNWVEHSTASLYIIS